MHPIDRRRRERIKRKRETSSGHVRPAEGKEARQTRRTVLRGAQQGWLKRLFTRQAAQEEVILMPPRPDTLSARRAERRRSKLDLRPAERVRPAGVIWISWRWVSGLMTAILIMMLAGLLISNAFYVDTIGVGGVGYLTREEVFRFSGISQKHIFWIDPAEVEAQLEANNNIADAEVRVSFPPGLVQIIVRERDPVLTWEQGGDRVWVDINGIVMFQREDRPDLLRIVFDPNETDGADPLGAGARIHQEIVHGSLLLRSQLRSIDVLLFHPTKGLGWRDPRGWTAWFGIGDNMAMKAIVYEGIVNEYFDEYQFSEIDVSDPDFPVFSFLWRKDQEG